MNMPRHAAGDDQTKNPEKAAAKPKAQKKGDKPTTARKQPVTSSDESEEDSDGEAQEVFWVKCDECQRWRTFNGLSSDEKGRLKRLKSWVCGMHPDEAQRGCDKKGGGGKCECCSDALPC